MKSLIRKIQFKIEFFLIIRSNWSLILHNRPIVKFLVHDTHNLCYIHRCFCYARWRFFTGRETTWPRLNHGGLSYFTDWLRLRKFILCHTIGNQTRLPISIRIICTMMERVYKPKMPLAFFASSWIILEQRPLFWRASVINNQPRVSLPREIIIRVFVNGETKLSIHKGACVPKYDLFRPILRSF